MKIPVFIVLFCFIAISTGVFVGPLKHKKHHLLGAKECTWGPTYWCKNLTAAADCHATKHCIQNVWVHKTLPKDNSNVCEICLDMVKQARDQLESNETQELIREVFEGTCKLIHIKPIVKECDKIADNYIPDLIDTLASEMNPQVVCSVAGLCNNEKFQLLIEQYENENIKDNVESKKIDSCDGCHTVVNVMENRLNQMTPDQLLQSFLELCGQMGSFSDGCSNIVITYFTHIQQHLRDNFNADSVCLMAGECSAKFHQHNSAANVEITPISHIGYVQVNNKNDDLPCDLCKQLVGHLRDLLVANTTQDEFKRVLQGLCNQTKSFVSECNSLVEEYYGQIYSFLVSELNSTVVCQLTGLCPNTNKLLGPIAPLLPAESVTKVLEITENPLKKVNLNNDNLNIQVLKPEQMQLPIDLLIPLHQQVYNEAYCVFCEYFLHYLQQQITNPTSEEAIKNLVDKACSKLPNSISETCISFVDMYEPAIIALLAQEIDPSQVCPLIKVCPGEDVKDAVEVFMQHKTVGDGKCPLCLFAVTKLEEMVKDEKTEDNIKNALDHLCDKLPGNLAPECKDFVNTYTSELVDLLMADLSPQEVCVYLRLCKDNRPAPIVPTESNEKYAVFEFFSKDAAPASDVNGDVDTNAIPDFTVNGRVVVDDFPDKKAECILSRWIKTEIQNQLEHETDEQKIKDAVYAVCDSLPENIKAECLRFIQNYGDNIILCIIDGSKIDEAICNWCDRPQINDVKVEIFNCAICESIVWTIEKILANPNVDHAVDHVLEKACRALPQKDVAKCQEIIEKYGAQIYNLIIHLEDRRLVCKQIGMCAAEPPRLQKQLGATPCTWGPSYWCRDADTANECRAVKHCQEKVWGGPRPKREILLGSNPCTWGPSYWCDTEEKANECSAIKHCQQKVWGGPRPKRQTALGSKPCTYGPSYWCQSEEKANECHAIKHCQDRVWLAAKPRN